jgi:hypothetical protein
MRTFRALLACIVAAVVPGALSAVGACGAFSTSTTSPEAEAGAADAEVGAAASEAGASDAEAGATNASAGIRCNKQVCGRGTICCASEDATAPPERCVAEDACEDKVFECDGPEDCAEGQRCCAHYSGGSLYGGSECLSSCEQAEVCNRNNGTDPCPPSTMCQSANFPEDFMYCDPPKYP